jgi:hypothetical protein
MKTIQSVTNPLLSVTIYPMLEYKGGSGYHFHTTGSDKAMSPLELMKLGLADGLEELRAQANFYTGPIYGDNNTYTLESYCSECKCPAKYCGHTEEL